MNRDVRSGSWTAVVGSALVASLTTCSGAATTPERLTDGTHTRPPAVALEGVDLPAVMAFTRTVASTRRPLPRSTASCIGSWGTPKHGPVVIRVGVDGRSVAFPSRSGRAVYACDGAGVRAQAWCGRAFGRVRAGHLLDPRLDLPTCPSSTDRIVAFAWVEPGARSRYVVVRHDGFVEVYATAARQPVRIATTSDVDLRRSQARFEISEHNSRGRKLRAYELRASVAG